MGENISAQASSLLQYLPLPVNNFNSITKQSHDNFIISLYFMTKVLNTFHNPPMVPHHHGLTMKIILHLSCHHGWTMEIILHLSHLYHKKSTYFHPIIQKPKHTWLCKTNGNDRQQKFVTPNGQIVEARRNMQ